jgi:hypothetical protein
MKEALKVIGFILGIIALGVVLFCLAIVGLNKVTEHDAEVRKVWYQHQVDVASGFAQSLCSQHGGVTYLYEEQTMKQYDVNARCFDGTEYKALNHMVRNKAGNGQDYP